MTNLTDITTVLLAERDGIHPAHAANRLAVAIRIADSIVVDARVMCGDESVAPTWGRANLLHDGELERDGRAILYRADAMNASLATRTLAVQIVEASR
jgi:hypothetical protein